MKKINIPLWIRFVAAATLFVTATELCFAQGLGEAPSGHWTTDMERSLRDIRENSAEMYGNLPDSHRGRLMESLRSRSFTFAGDGGFSAAWTFENIPHTVSGTWTMKEGNILAITLSSGIREYGMQVEGEDKLVLTLLEDTGGIQRKLFFNKDPGR